MVFAQQVGNVHDCFQLQSENYASRAASVLCQVLAALHGTLHLLAFRPVSVEQLEGRLEAFAQLIAAVAFGFLDIPATHISSIRLHKSTLASTSAQCGSSACYTLTAAYLEDTRYSVQIATEALHTGGVGGTQA